jgi:hypothetical protein
MQPQQGIYLRDLRGAALTTYYSERAQRRAVQLHRFVSELTMTLPTPRSPLPELMVVRSGDWYRLSSQLYGLPQARVTKSNRQLLVAAEYPDRLLHRFDSLLFRAKQHGFTAPGDLRELLDLMVGQGWGQLAAGYLGIYSGVRWADTLIGSYLFLVALNQLQSDTLAERLTAWAEVMVRSADSAAKLTDYRPLRTYTEFAHHLGLWGQLTLRASELLTRETQADCLGQFASALASAPLTRHNLVHRLTNIDATFAPWLSERND